jgi:hypothetical protein
MAKSLYEMQSFVNRVVIDVAEVFKEGILSRRHWIGLLGSWSCDSRRRNQRDKQQAN